VSFDDHPLFLEGVSSVFKKKKEFRVASCGRSADDLVEIARRQQPDIIVTDMNMGGCTVSAIRTILAENLRSKVIVFSAFDTAEHAIAALEAGAKGFVQKGSSSEELVAAMRMAMAGDIFITPSLATKVISALQKKTVEKPVEETQRLTHREAQIVQMLLEGKSNRAIADFLHLSEKTVKGYMSNLMQKFNARSRLEIVVQLRQEQAAPSFRQQPVAPLRQLMHAVA
jgi:two-component system, NarL family, nitrate/nitrite response regulator NarL